MYLFSGVRVSCNWPLYKWTLYHVYLRIAWAAYGYLKVILT